MHPRYRVALLLLLGAMSYVAPAPAKTRADLVYEASTPALRAAVGISSAHPELALGLEESWQDPVADAVWLAAARSCGTTAPRRYAPWCDATAAAAHPRTLTPRTLRGPPLSA